MSDMSTSNVRNIQQSVDPLLHKPLLLPETKLPENVTKLDDNMSFGKFRMEVIEGDIFPFAPKHAGDQVITIPSKRDCSQHDLFTRWKNKLQKILHQTRDFEFSFCEADSNVWHGKHLSLESFCEVKVSLFITLGKTKPSDEELEVHSCLERGEHRKYTEFYWFLQNKFRNNDVGIPFQPSLFPPNMLEEVAVDNELCKEYIISLLRILKNSKHTNSRVAALRSVGRLGSMNAIICNDRNIIDQLVDTVDGLGKICSTNETEKEFFVVTLQRLLLSPLDTVLLTTSRSIVQLVFWIIHVSKKPPAESFRWVQSARLVADSLCQLSQRRKDELLSNLDAHGFRDQREQFYELSDMEGLDPCVRRSIIHFRNAYA